MEDAAAGLPAAGRPDDAIAPRARDPARTRLLDRSDLRVLAALVALFAVTRSALFPFAENLYGDAVVRSEIAERFAEEPHLAKSFKDGVYQFGPLHFYAMAAVLEVWPSREHATRFLSLLAGVLLVFPFYRLGRRLFGRAPAILATLWLSLWPLHLQASTTAASEALMLTLVFFALDLLFQGIHEERFSPLAFSALALNLACATRYDGWMLVPLCAVTVALSGADRVASLTRAVMFTVLASVFPLLWMQGNEKATGDALYPIHYIDDFHARWVKDGVEWLGEWKYRLHNLFFWPGSLVTTCSPLVGLFALLGLARAFAVKRNRALALLAIVPTAYFAFRGAVLLNFSPLARFTMLQLAIALLFFGDGFAWASERLQLSLLARRSVLGLTALVAVATPLWLGHVTAWKTGMWPDMLRPISPLSTVPLEQMAAARFLSRSMAAGEALVVDEDPRYVDITVAYFTGIPEARLVRRRWDNYEKQLSLHPEPRWILATSDGALKKEDVAAGAEEITFRGRAFERVASTSPSLFVYRAR